MVISNPYHGTFRGPSILKPLLRAYLFAHASTTGPRLLSCLFSFYRKGLKTRQILAAIYNIVLSSIELNSFPTFSAVLIGSYTALQYPIGSVLKLVCRSRIIAVKDERVRKALIRFIAAFLASWFSLRLLNGVKGSSESTRVSKDLTNVEAEKLIHEKRINTYHHERSAMEDGLPLVGKTLDLSITVAVRAVETLIGDLWLRRSNSNAVKGYRNSAYRFLSRSADVGVFVISAGTVMWAWFYLPERLPQEYNKWIGQAAQVDQRLVQVLRNARWGEFVYGQDTGQASILQGMCKDYNWPLVWGDPAQTIPIPCEMVHMGTGPSCHYHALVRFVRAFKFSLSMYLPLQLLVKARHPSLKALKSALKDAVRSSAFLGAFISMFYYSVCLSRTLLGPRIFNQMSITPTMIDSGLCVGAGCIMCGWSILLEAEKRRQEIAFFVAPRAVATILPRRYERKLFWREQLVFSIGTGVLFTFAQENSAKVRGVLGQVIHRILE